MRTPFTNGHRARPPGSAGRPSPLRQSGLGRPPRRGTVPVCGVVPLVSGAEETGPAQAPRVAVQPPQAADQPGAALPLPPDPSALVPTGRQAGSAWLSAADAGQVSAGHRGSGSACRGDRDAWSLVPLRLPPGPGGMPDTSRGLLVGLLCGAPRCDRPVTAVPRALSLVLLVPALACRRRRWPATEPSVPRATPRRPALAAPPSPAHGRGHATKKGPVAGALQEP